MKVEHPKISVLMPAYNAAKYIGEAITSVLQQTFADFELIVVNDGSTDGTESVIRSFTDCRIVLINQSNMGVAGALNTGLKNARAKYVARFDADDICNPKRLEIQYDFIELNPEYDILGSAVDYIDMNGHYVFNHQPPGYSNEQIQNLKYSICPFIHSSVFYKRDVILNAGGYNRHAYSFEDHLLWRTILDRVKVFNFSQPLITVRLNPESITIDEKWRTRAFRSIKYSALKNCSITEAQGNRLVHIGKTQGIDKVKHGAYYALLAKKFLWNNHQPIKARQNLKKVIAVNRLDWKTYVLLLMSFLPQQTLFFLYRSAKFRQAEVVYYDR